MQGTATTFIAPNNPLRMPFIFINTAFLFIFIPIFYFGPEYA